ncbi:uncharacterized protein LOC111706035 [Eurytemora carolleeae]|uniref:uncharacterized protein LOC111706035 n=1 Tax=Eurytemora carolleeae TaxID=1294199 RepID=UPI000C76F60F|nr:uncharacterized protein LOC111706035 [Eurytemora carolleeae]|eukprot:XP_023334559.1 uncharacterized protein LOC111706035 [Eurytemora affinis]
MYKTGIIFFTLFTLSIANTRDAETRIGSPYILPESCSKCSDDIEDILHYCTYASPECIGALVYAKRDCIQCICEVVTDGLNDDISSQLCPICPQLPICSPE